MAEVLPGAPNPGSGRRATVFRAIDGDARYAWTRRRRNRLLLVVVQGGVILAALLLVVGGRPLPALLAILPFFPLMALINIGIHGVLDVPRAELDQVMITIRNEARARAYSILVVLLGVTVVLAPFGAALIGDRAPDQPVAAIVVPSGVVGALFFVVLLLPTWLVAWRLPDGDAPAESAVLRG